MCVTIASSWAWRFLSDGDGVCSAARVSWRLEGIIVMISRLCGYKACCGSRRHGGEIFEGDGGMVLICGMSSLSPVTLHAAWRAWPNHRRWRFALCRRRRGVVASIACLAQALAFTLCMRVSLGFLSWRRHSVIALRAVHSSFTGAKRWRRRLDDCPRSAPLRASRANARRALRYSRPTRVP